MNRHRLPLMGLTLALVACTPKPAPGPAPSASGAASDPSSAAIVASAPALAPNPIAPATKPSGTSPTEEGESADTWFVVSGDGAELGVIELRAGHPPKLQLSVQSEPAAKLEARLKEIGGPEGIGIDMHLPSPSGQGRGPYGTVLAKYDDKLYRHALKQRLEPKYSIREVLALVVPLPPAVVKKVHISRSGEKVGSVDFSKTPPKLTPLTEKSDASSLKSDLERVQELGTLKFRYHHIPDGGVDTLVNVESKPGDANYAQTVVLYLMVERYYRPRYAYQLTFE